MKKIFHLKKGFTLMELLIVIGIIGILMTIGIFPYKDYMERAELSNTIDNIGQEWILAHKEIRNGLEQSGSTDKKHLGIIFHLKNDEKEILRYNVDWDKIAINTENGYTFDEENKISETLNNLDSFEKKKILLGDKIEIKNLDLPDNIVNNEIFYIAIPPFAEGKFFTKNGQKVEIDQLQAKIGFEGSTISTNPNIKNPKIKTILLRPYLQ